jgi:flagella basal body P-ring formation protein FlgA
MIRTIVVSFAVAIALTSSAMAQVLPQEIARPKLRAEAVVAGDLVRIGDLIDNAGVVANVPIFRAPDLGTTGTVSAIAIVEAVRAHALIGLDTGGIDKVTVTHASRTIAPKDVEDCIAQALARQFNLGTPADVSLSIDGGLRPLQVDQKAAGELQVAHISYERYGGRFQATVEVPTGPSTRSALRVSGRASATVEVAAVTHPIERGAILRDGDVILERHPRAQVRNNDAITDRARAIGLAARSDLQPGQPLRKAQLMRPELVKRNEHVTLVYEAPGITLTVRGKATESGAEGDVISVLNEQSKRTLQGTVVGPGRVVVSSGLSHLADSRAPATGHEAH